MAGWARRLPAWAQVVCPATLVFRMCWWRAARECFDGAGSLCMRCFRWRLLGFCLAGRARRRTGQSGNWRDFLVLAVLGLAVDLRWFEAAWPAHLAIFSKMLLLDAGIYGFLAVRRWTASASTCAFACAIWRIGLRELVFYTPIALVLGLSLGFLHIASGWPGVAPIAGAWIFTFIFIAVPEELFFRGWLQNLLERRMGRTPALLVTAVLFGLSHFNKRAVFFNWRYVLLAAVAGIFYGRAWRQQRRVGASAITHASVDAIWSLMASIA